MSALSLQPSAALEDVKLLNSLSNNKKSRFLTSCRMLIWRNRKTLRNVSMEDKRDTSCRSVCTTSVKP